VPWKVSDVYEARVRFVLSVERGDLSLSAVCDAHGISREAGYKWLARYRAGGLDGLRDLSRAPRRQAGAMAPEVSAAIVALRRKHRFWGPKKLRAVLDRECPGTSWPAPSTIGDLLCREGLVEARRLRRRGIPVEQPFAPVEAANDLWCIDFKGWFRTGDGRRCDPLTVTDAQSRYLLTCEALEPTGAEVERACNRLFREYGLPRAMRMDNGTPFASSGAAGLTRLSVGWVKLGIRLERIDPGSPQQNGRHERMHRTLKQQTAQPPAANAREQQAKFDDFRREFNEQRPHEALGQVTPGSRYTASNRSYPVAIEELCYAGAHEVRHVRTDGAIKFRGKEVYVSQALAGELVGLFEIDDDQWLVRFAELDIGMFGRGRKLERFASARPGRRKTKATGAVSTM